ncbi:hypothetical protein DYB34_005323 [Aphanomyces astaci]|uniref:Methyltransferase domain-containing protein n=1 Tax=Aphanomyces astaci TaxID=112090 RepID=A0A3R7AT50_APHAT|nr:hypothetical protein DYB34_005323 [Aphanomyces astaci]
MASSTAPRVLRSWKPSHYMKFGSQRLRPALDLLQLVHDLPSAANVMDLGCGPGNITPFIRFVAILSPCLDRIEYVHGNFESFHSDIPVDVIYSNAALHWVSYNVHETLLPRLFNTLATTFPTVHLLARGLSAILYTTSYMNTMTSLLQQGGAFAFQMPDTRQQPSHVLMGEAANQLNLDVSNVRWVTTDVNADAYYKLLRPLTRDIHLWSTEYVYQLEAQDNNIHPVVDYVSSTGLAPYVDALTPAQRPAFMDTYHELIAKAYPVQEDGRVLLPYKRFFCVAVQS